MSILCSLELANFHLTDQDAGRGTGGKQIREKETRKRPGPVARSYLIRIHLEFANNFDGNFDLLYGVSGTIDIAEGTVSHLLQKDISF